MSWRRRNQGELESEGDSAKERIFSLSAHEKKRTLSGLVALELLATFRHQSLETLVWHFLANLRSKKPVSFL